MFSPVKRIAISFWLGFSSVFVFVLGAEPFDAPRPTPVKAILVGCTALALFLAVGQFWIVRKGGLGLRAVWPGLVATDLAVLGWFLFMVAFETRSNVLSRGVPMLLSGCFGSLAGAVIAARGAGRAHNANG